MTSMSNSILLQFLKRTFIPSFLPPSLCPFAPLLDPFAPPFAPVCLLFPPIPVTLCTFQNLPPCPTFFLFAPPKIVFLPLTTKTLHPHPRGRFPKSEAGHWGNPENCKKCEKMGAQLLLFRKMAKKGQKKVKKWVKKGLNLAIVV